MAAELTEIPADDRPLSPPEWRYRQQWRRLETLRGQLAGLDTLQTRFDPLFQQALQPGREQEAALQRALALALDSHLQGKVLAAAQRRAAVAVLCRLAGALGRAGDAEMAALHDRHSPLNSADRARARADQAQGWHERAGAEQARREAAAERRRERRNRRAPDAGVAQAAETLLRGLYRQLASALHPDRAPDEATRQRRHALMSEANAAYARRDLPALMALQRQAEQAEVDPAAGRDGERLAALTQLLKDQVAALERERAARQRLLAQRYGLEREAQVNPVDLACALQARVSAQQARLVALQADLDAVADPRRCPRWLDAQDAQDGAA